MILILVIWAVTASSLAYLSYRKDKKNLKTIDCLLDDILSNRKLDTTAHSSLTCTQESTLSLIMNRLERVQEKLQLEVSKADEEKEQVKQLISNMSHQLKTPIANLMMYTQLLESDTLTPDERALFLSKLHFHSEHIDWILNSLFKMSKLEQNVISFDATNCNI